MKHLLLMALITSGTLLCAYTLKFTKRHPGGDLIAVHGLYGIAHIGRTGFFNTTDSITARQGINKLRVWHQNRYLLKVQHAYDYDLPILQKDMNFEVQYDGTLKPVKE